MLEMNANLTGGGEQKDRKKEKWREEEIVR